MMRKGNLVVLELAAITLKPFRQAPACALCMVRAGVAQEGWTWRALHAIR